MAMLAGSEQPAAGLFLSRGTGRQERFLLLENRLRREWGFPKGHAHRGESSLACARRECAEESGIGLVAVQEGVWELVYDLPDGRRKRVTYFGATTCQETVVLSREHRRSVWLDAASAMEHLAFTNLRGLFRRFLDERQPSC